MILTALVVPTGLLITAHLSSFTAATFVADHLVSTGTVSIDFIPLFIAVHGLVLVSLCLYIVSAIPLGMEIMPLAVKGIYGIMNDFVVTHGLPAANSVGRAYALFGVVFIAIPIASAIPGARSVGPFSCAYGVVVVALLIFRFWKPVPGASR